MVTPGDVEAAVVRVEVRGEVRGTGFVATDEWVITCAHVVADKHERPLNDVQVVLHGTGTAYPARVLPEFWSPPSAEDVAILHIAGPIPPGVVPMQIGHSTGTADHACLTFGYPAVGVMNGLWGHGTVYRPVTEINGRKLIQVASKEITRGFSGAPLLDQHTRRVIGMVTEIVCPDAYGRLPETALITPSETLQTICPALHISDICPYRGLLAFTEDEADFFFGRQALVDELVEHLRRQPRFLAVVGSSGSGKSSVIQAGVLPRLRRGQVPGFRAPILLSFRPGAAPHDALHVALRAMGATTTDESIDVWSRLRLSLNQNPGKRLVLFGDQFEEIFALCPEPQRTEFLQGLAGLVQSPLSVTLMVTVRADFYDPLLCSPVGRHLSTGQVNVQPMTDNELREAMTRPAAKVGLELEAGLAEAITNDLAATRHMLPLLEFALTQLWEYRRDGMLTYDAYRQIGGATGALGWWASETYNNLSAAERILARQVFTRLIHYGEGDMPDMRRRLPFSRLLAARGERHILPQVIQQLADARLLVTDRDPHTGDQVVEIIHDALLREWLQLGEWIREHRAFLLWRQRLQGALAEWERLRRDDGALLRGAVLVEASRWLTERPAELDPTEQEYVQTSQRQQEQEAAQEKQQQARLRDAVYMYAVRQFADDPARRAALLRECRYPAQTHAWMACAADTVRESAWHFVVPGRASSGYPACVFNQDGSMVVCREDNPTDAYLLQLWQVGQVGQPVTYALGDTLVSQSVLYQYFWLAFDVVHDRLWTLLPSAVLQSWRVEAGPDLRLEGVRDTVEYGRAGEKTWTYQHIDIREVQQVEGVPGSFEPDSDRVVAVGYAARVHRLLTCHRNGAMRLWDLEAFSPPTLLPFTLREHSSPRIPLSPDGMWAVWLDREHAGSASLLYLASDQEIPRRTLGHNVSAVDFSPDSAWVVMACEDGMVRMRSTTEGSSILIQTQAGPLTAVAFSQDGTRIVVGSADGILHIWPFSGQQQSRTLETWWQPKRTFNADGMSTYQYVRPPDAPLVRRAHTGKVQRIVVDPSGTWMLTTSSDDTAQLWRADGTGTPVGLRGHGTSMTEASFSPDGRWVITTCPGQAPRVWPTACTPDPQVVMPPAWVHGQVSHLVVETCRHGDVLWTLFSDDHLRRSTVGATDQEATVAFDYDASTGWTGRTDPELRWMYKQADGLEARLFPLRNEREPLVLHGVTNKLQHVAVTTDGKWILGLIEDGAAVLWDADQPTRPTPFGPPGLQCSAAAFSTDGRRIVTGAQHGAVYVWNADGTGQPVLVGTMQGPVSQVEFSPDDVWVLSQGQAGTALVAWASGRKEAVPLVYSDLVRFIRHGQAVLAVLSDGVLVVRRKHSGVLVHRLRAEIGRARALSPDGRWILTHTDTGELQVWSTEHDLEPVVLQGAGHDVTAVASAPDGGRIYTGHKNGVVLIWNVDLAPASLTRRLWQATPYCLTVEERRNLLAEDLDTAVKNRYAALDKAATYHSRGSSTRSPSSTPDTRRRRRPSGAQGRRKSPPHRLSGS